MQLRRLALTGLVMMGMTLAASAQAQSDPPRPAPPKPVAPGASDVTVAPKLDPKALDVLKAMSAKLAAARTMTFSAVSRYESPSVLGPPIVYTTLSDVALQRPNQFRVITPGDGPASDFYWNGKTMMAFAPGENLVAQADAPATLDEMLKAAYRDAAIYFPFSDAIVADPYTDIAEGLGTAFVVGQSRIVGGTTTDMVVIANDRVFAQIWVGAADKLPRMVRAVYADDPARLRHEVEFSNWRLDGPIAADTFVCARCADARRIAFAAPEPVIPPNVKAFQPPKAKKK